MTVLPATQASSPLARPVNTLWGVGGERTAQLSRLNLFTIQDLLLHRPRRYEDRRQFRPIGELQLEEPSTTRGQVVAMGVKRFQRGRKSVFELILSDGSGRLHCRWWNLPYMEKYFQVGDEVVVFGKPLSLKPRTMDHPETEVIDSGEERLIHLNRITPVYPLTEGLPQRWLRSLIWRTLERYESKIPEPGDPGAPHVDTGGFPTFSNAVHMLHFPETFENIEIARRRLALDELLELQLQIQRRRANFESHAAALPCGGDNRLIKPFLAGLGFRLTEAQMRVLREIRADMRGKHPMRRLLQGDVGSGKTAVAGCAALMAIESGYSVALMAPTEILAGQHFMNFSKWFGPLGVQVQLQTQNQKERTGAGGERGNGKGTMYIGTHALIEAAFSPPDLGLVIIDEQHKFGVGQREQLVRKGRYPHLLVMTATPIPRTLGLTIYGDLDISVVDAPPPGRGRVKTVVRDVSTLPKVWSFVREKLAEGRQAYVVYPRVEDTGQPGVKAVTKEHEKLQQLLRPFKVGLLHGRMKAPDKDAVMAGFRSNTVHVLLATSLVEVGLDVPNASVMLIENAEQFGLAQLHQLRGRIGRGPQNSYCILISSATTPEARMRLKILEETNDGFRIAEADLKLRGPGEFLGPQQSGLPAFRFADLASDWELVQMARKRAAEILEEVKGEN
jgi:ATP-dependent DNA helicase RecG